MANEFVARKGIISSGSINVSGSVTASYFKGDGSQLTNLPSSTVLSSSVNIDTYTFNGDGSTKIFLLSQSYNVNSLEVFVDGLAQINITDYTLSSATLTFVDTPPSASNILIKAFTNVTQNATGSFSGSFFGIIATSSFATTASAATSITFTPSTASFATTAGSVNTLNQNVSASGNIAAGVNLISNFSSGDEGGEILLAKPQTNTTLSGTGVTIDVYQNKLRIFEQGGTARGGYFDITGLAASVGTNLAGGGGTVTSITAGNGLTGGTITGAGTITVDTGSTHFSSGVTKVLPAGTVSSSTQQVVATYTNGVDNRVLTATSANGITAESTLTYDGTVLSISTNGAKYFQGGDDAALYDVNVANTLGIHGVQDSTVGAIKLGSSGQTIYSNATGVGIGTTSPAALLHVQGNISASSFTGSLRSPGVVSSSAQYPGWVTSSAQINTGSFSGSLTGSVLFAVVPNIRLQADNHLFVGDGVTTAYTLSSSYDPAILTVSVDGMLNALTEDYSVSTTTLTFVTAPPTSSNIFAKGLRLTLS